MDRVQAFVAQAAANLEFHERLCTNFPDDHFDWKNTVLFYAALHYLKALAAKRLGGKGSEDELGATHFDIENAVKPQARGNREKPKMVISVTAWDNYHALFVESQNARYYSPKMDLATFKVLRKNEHEKCLKYLEDFRKYIERLLAS